MHVVKEVDVVKDVLIRYDRSDSLRRRAVDCQNDAPCWDRNVAYCGF